MDTYRIDQSLRDLFETLKHGSYDGPPDLRDAAKQFSGASDACVIYLYDKTIDMIRDFPTQRRWLSFQQILYNVYGNIRNCMLTATHPLMTAHNAYIRDFKTK